MFKIPYSDFTFTFSRSSGAGGQNVNKVNTKVTMIWAIDSAESVPNSVKERFKDKYKRFIVGSEVIIHSQLTRSQSQNIDDCISKLHEMLASVKYAPKKRRATKPTKGSIKRRLDGKKKHSDKKKSRSEKF